MVVDHYYFAFGIIFRDTKFSSNLLLATEPTIHITEQPSNTSQGNSNRPDVLFIGCTIFKVIKLKNWVIIKTIHFPANCGLQIYGGPNEPFSGYLNQDFDPDECGDICGGSMEGTTNFFCEKNEICCPSGPSDQTCAITCGPFNINGNFIDHNHLWIEIK